ncbi:GntR family transcriptional regulator [Phreatobacter stygius]|uniref:GntR family transcriptional regulator n=1 Tax=Phreatobacter stygius TaxID=1940610 RepID=UPI001476E262|nr:GntR family transcriptional regulator [Phreatobacter stygius]
MPPVNAAPEPTPIVHFDRGTVRAQVHAQLRRLVMLGRFRPGQALKLNDLANALGTSLQPVREAVRQLVAEKALEALPNRSARVPRADHAKLDDLQRVRFAIEGLAAELAAARVTRADIATLDAIVEAEVRELTTSGIEASVAQNLEFHFALYRMSGSAILPPIIESLWLQFGPHMRQAADAFYAADDRATDHHRAIIVALKERDVMAVRAAVERDIGRSFDIVRTLLDKPGTAKPRRA